MSSYYTIAPLMRELPRNEHNFDKETEELNQDIISHECINEDDTYEWVLSHLTEIKDAIWNSEFIRRDVDEYKGGYDLRLLPEFLESEGIINYV